MIPAYESPHMTLSIQSEPLRAAILSNPGVADNPAVAVVNSVPDALATLPGDSSAVHLLLVELANLGNATAQRHHHEQTLCSLHELAVGRSGLRTIVFSDLQDAESVVSALCHGASGYLVKDPEQDMQAQAALIAHGMQELAAGHTPISSSVAHHLVDQVQRLNPSPVPVALSAAKNLLSKRETEVLKLAAKGFTYAEMAGLLELSVHTISTHVRRIYAKFEVNSRGEAIYEASRQGLLREMAPAA